MMFDLIKKSILAGIGSVAAGEEKIRKLVDEVVQKGKITQQEGKTLVDELQKVVQENKDKLSSTIDERVHCLLKGLDLLTQKDLSETERRVKEELRRLEERLAALEKDVKAPERD